MKALISVSDKTGVVEFAKGLVALGWEILSTSGTMKLLKESGVPVTSVSDVTGRAYRYRRSVNAPQLGQELGVCHSRLQSC